MDTAYVKSIEQCVRACPDALALRGTGDRFVSYAWLWRSSEATAALLEGMDLEDHRPVAVFGHKSPWMIACFLGCLKSGHPYVPIDFHSVPQERVRSILDQLEYPVVLAPESASLLDSVGASRLVTGSELEKAVEKPHESNPSHWVAGEDLAYILFTSGSTGTPKGVEVTASCLDNFAAWSRSLLGELRESRPVIINQAPFSFDLSVYEQTMALATGGSIWSLTHDELADARSLFASLGRSFASVWVSTPSFAEFCLADPLFDEALMPRLRLFVFCGETLANRTALKLLDRFPRARVLNTYGPTESTVAVAACNVTRSMALAPEPLPVGTPRPGTRFRIVRPDGMDAAPGASGEIVIEGDTVAAGYWGRQDLTDQVFGKVMLDGAPCRSYRTGDEGWIDAFGMLHYHGRIDLQVKLNGFRIELGDIEEHMRALDLVDACAVVPISSSDGRISHLEAFVVPADPAAPRNLTAATALKRELKQILPHYMIPRKITFVDALPMTPNGKVDRASLRRREVQTAR